VAAIELGKAQERRTAALGSSREDPAWPVDPGEDTVLLVCGASPVERRVLEEWVSRDRAGASAGALEIAAVGESRLGDLLSGNGDRWVAPARIAWLPPERDGDRMAGVKDLLMLTNPRRPPERLKTRILEREPDRCRVIAGEPARVSELRERWESTDSHSPFPEFVARQGTLALERAERDLVGDRYKIPRLVYEEVTTSGRFRSEVEGLAAELDRPVEEVEREAATYIDEMGASQSRLAIDLWAQFGRVLSRAYEIELDEAGLEELRRLNQETALVFLPSHKSYLDPMVLRPVLTSYGFPPNHILGGLNVGFWPIGPWARRAGIVFIRRSFRDNPVYKLALREYLHYLLRKRFNLEWYIEGGRSRSGKLRPPRYGILRYLSEAFVAGSGEDVHLVPVSIAYEQLYETRAIAAESQGAEKKPEGIAWLLGYLRSQGEHGLGKVRVSFGEPLSLREGLRLGLEGKEDLKLSVQKTAFEVCHRINRVTPLTPTSLVTLALLGVKDRALTTGEIGAILDPILEYVQRRELPTAGALRLGDTGEIRRTLEALVRSDVVAEFDGGTEPVWSIGPDQHLVAAFYRNTAIHFFVNRAIAELVLARAAKEGFADPVADGWEEALRLRDLLKFEFFFPSTEDFAGEIREELAILDPAWEEREKTQQEIWELLFATPFHLAHRVLRSFVEAYLVLADRLAARDPRSPVIEKEFLAECVGVGRQYRLQGRTRSTESISEELFRNGLKLAANRDLLDPGRDPVAEGRRQFAEEMRGIVDRLNTIRDLALEDLARAGAPGVE
jgi:glycerol-3-phosphate O-acyltransferase